MGADARKFPRSRVHLRVSYKRGQDLVEKYADNLSAGGLFVCDAEGLGLRDTVLIEIELPKHGVFRVNAEVMHAIGANDPKKRRAGVGLQLKSPPNVFVQALEAYLRRLEKRTGAKVFVDMDPWRLLLSEAGYTVMPLPPPFALVEVIGDTTTIGMLTAEDMVEQYRNALAFLGEDGSLVIPIRADLPVEPVLAWLDDKLLKS